MNFETNQYSESSQEATAPTVQLPEGSDGSIPTMSSFQRATPTLGRKTFLLILGLLLTLPVATVALIGSFLPPVQEGTLKAKIQAVGLPEPEFYQVKYNERPEFEGGFMLVTNTGDEDWTNFEITLNTFYQIYDYRPIKPGETVSFNLDRFNSKMGAKFSLRYNEVRYVRIYARLPSKKRATYYQRFDTVADGTRQ